MNRLPPAAMAELVRARGLLASSHLVIRLTGLLGRAFDMSGGAVLRRLPGSVRDGLDAVVRRALTTAVSTALLTVGRDGPLARITGARWFGAASVAVSGFTGGAAGLPGTLLELPVTTMLLMRAILEVARAEGEDLSSPEVLLAVLEVFALGGPEPVTEGSYFVARIGTTELLRQAAGQGIAGIMPRAVATVATRFGVPVAWKLAGQAIPIAGAAAGAALNVAFLDHFTARARGHFIVRRLERVYGADAVRTAFAG